MGRWTSLHTDFIIQKVSLYAIYTAVLIEALGAWRLTLLASKT